MEVFEAVRTVLAVCEFQDKPVPADAARRIVEAAQSGLVARVIRFRRTQSAHTSSTP